MPSYTAKDRLDEAALFLNDPNRTQYTYSVLLPFLKIALQELEDIFIANGVSFVLKESAVIPVLANALTLTLPSDFLLPIKLEERATGSSDTFKELLEKEFTPEDVPADELKYWTWDNGQIISFLGATTNRDVNLYYYRALAVVNVPDDAVSINHVKQYLSGRSASIAAFVIGENTTRAQVLDALAQTALDRALAIATKRNQGKPVRRKPYGTSRRA